MTTSAELATELLAELAKELGFVEKEIAHGCYKELHELTRVQGTLAGIERARALCLRVLANQDDQG